MKKPYITCLIIILALLLTRCGKTEMKEEKESTIQSSPPSIVNLKEDIIVQEETTTTPIVEEESKSNDEVVQDVLNGLYGNGQERYDKLTAEGYDADLIQSLIDEMVPAEVQDMSTGTIEPQYYSSSEGALNPYVGVVYYNGHKETYYSQRVLPGDGLNIPGRHVAGDGTIRDGEGYICVAADPSYLPYGSLIETSLGAGKVYDSGCDYGTIDIYTDW